MHFTGEVNLGSIFTAASVILALYFFHIKNVERIVRIETQVSAMWKTFQHTFMRGREDE